VAWALLVAREKRRRLASARRARSRGIVVVCDRYPQADIMGYNDGPLLGDWIDHRSKWRRALARRELSVYQSFTRFPPDLVVKLHVTPALAARRKEIASLDLLRRKADGIKRLHYPETTAVLDLDADRPLESVLHDIKGAIWSRI
jgi:thymidylate kinase